MISRREFIKHALRTLLLGGLAIMGFRLATRPERRTDVCTTGRGVCRGCPALARCDHPNALSFKEATHHETP